MTKISSISVILNLTFTDRACESCTRKLYNARYRCEIPAVPRTRSTSMFIRLRVVNDLYYLCSPLQSETKQFCFVLLFFNTV